MQLAPFIQKVLFYGFSLGIESLIALLLLPILSHSISPAEYGYWSIFIAVAGFLRPCVSMMLHEVIRMKFFRISEHEITSIVFLACTIPFLIVLLLFCFGSFTFHLIRNYVGFSEEAIGLVLIFSYLHGLFYFLLALFQFRERKLIFISLQVIQTVLSIFFTLLLLHYNYSWLSPVLGRIVALFFAVIFGLYHSSVHRIFSYLHMLTYRKVREFLFCGSSFILTGLSLVVIPLTDRVIVAHSEGPEATGYYGIASLFSMSLILYVNAFIFTWQPSLFAYASGKNSSRVFFLSRIFFTSLPFFLLLALAASWIFLPFLISYDVSKVYPYIVNLCVATSIQGIYMHNYTILQAYQLTFEIAFISLVVVILNVLFDIMFVNSFGPLGAAWATALSFLVGFLLSSSYVFKIISPK
jgi:O-antigen/teichoic acid export membrane protein